MFSAHLLLAMHDLRFGDGRFQGRPLEGRGGFEERVEAIIRAIFVIPPPRLCGEAQDGNRPRGLHPHFGIYLLSRIRSISLDVDKPIGEE